MKPKTIRAQLALLQPLMDSCSLKTMRRGQNKIGELMCALQKDSVVKTVQHLAGFDGVWVMPKDERRQGVILYLHGGGYACGNLDYAAGFGSVLANECGVRVFCAAYRLAPETPFPGALEDAVAAYRYLLEKGYTQITLCGESAGGGLCYCLCQRLRALQLPMPCGILAISPWTDLTMSGTSYEENREKDVSMSQNRLRFFADAYTDDPKNPLVSPLFGDLSALPPSLIFVGAEEIMRSDSQDLHKKLLEYGCKSKLIVTPNRWHAYLLYNLNQDRRDFLTINSFLNATMGQEQKLRWMRLDNAAKIYPAARSENWSSIYRVSATLTEAVDVPVLEKALDITVRRFPSIAVRLRRGVFWYYLQQITAPPAISPEYSHPLTRMHRDDIRKCAFRVIVYDRRIAFELFHSITDGTGAMIFLKSLVAEYLQQKYQVRIPATCGVLDRLQEPSAQEMEDSFPKYAGTVPASRADTNAWHLTGTPEPGGFLHLTCMQLEVDRVKAMAKSFGVSITAFLSACMMMALQNMQAEKVPNRRRRKPLKVLIPVNLRSFFPSQSLRNFAYFTIPEIDPRLGDYSLEEICRIVQHRMGLELTDKQLACRIATNVNSEKLLIVRLMPLFVKNFVMKAVFKSVGERKSCLNMSNLGNIQLPEEMASYVTRMDFILGVQAYSPYNCGVLSYGNKVYINFIRDTKESDLEYHFFCVLRDLGLEVQVESNTKVGGSVCTV